MLKFDDSLIAKNIAIATEYLKAYYSIAYREKKFSGGTTGFIPFNIEFTIDGLSGIKIYNKLRIDTSFLPDGYPITLDFIVTGIEHKLKDGDWETVIKTTMIPKLEATEVVVTSANFKATIYPPPVNNNNNNNVVLTGDVNLSSTVGGDGVYHSPPKKADATGEYVDVMLTVKSDAHLRLAKANGGLFPIKFYTKPGDSSGTLYGKVVNIDKGGRNQYEPDPEFNKNLVQWKYVGESGFTQKRTVNKIIANTLTQMAQHLDSQGWWNSTYILTWDCGINRRDMNPKRGITYGYITNHAFGMAIDINSGSYPLGSVGKTNYDKDIVANVPTALALDSLNKAFSLTQGGEQKVFWLYPGDTHHFSIFEK